MAMSRTRVSRKGTKDWCHSIQAGVCDRNHQSGEGPVEAPAKTPSANSMEDGDAEKAKFNHVRHLAYRRMKAVVKMGGSNW